MDQTLTLLLRNYYKNAVKTEYQKVETFEKTLWLTFFHIFNAILIKSEFIKTVLYRYYFFPLIFNLFRSVYWHFFNDIYFVFGTHCKVKLFNNGVS